MNDIEFIRNELILAIREIDELKAANSRLMQRISDLEVDVSCGPDPETSLLWHQEYTVDSESYPPEEDELSKDS